MLRICSIQFLWFRGIERGAGISKQRLLKKDFRIFMNKPLLIKRFVTGLPRYCRPQHEAFEWLAAAHARAAATESRREDTLAKWQERATQLVRRYSCSEEHIGWRRSEIEDFMHTDWPRMRIFNLHENPRGCGLNVRNNFYAETVTRAVASLFADEPDAPSDVLHVSCTGYVSPSAVQRLIDAKGWNGRTQATHVYHMGCYAALPALRIAAGLLSRGNGNNHPRADLVHTELCTLHFNPADHSPGQLVIQTLFADGHIRYSVEPGEHAELQAGENALEVLAVREETVPDSLDDMTWDLSEWGFQMTLSRDVPGKIAGSLPGFLLALFEHAGLRYSEETGNSIFAVHPGGPRILDSVEEIFQLEKRQLQWSRTVLFERGNMSSATLPHIWMAIASDASIKTGTIIVSLAFGPGLTIAGALFRKC
jgi:predicted naringenin-chalcone synthase